MAEFKLPHNHGDSKNAIKIHRELSNLSRFNNASELFKQLGDTTRLRVFWLLCHREECVINIAALLNMTSPAVSHHLRPLKELNLIRKRSILPCRRHGGKQTAARNFRAGNGGFLPPKWRKRNNPQGNGAPHTRISYRASFRTDNH